MISGYVAYGFWRGQGAGLERALSVLLTVFFFVCAVCENGVGAGAGIT